MKVDEICKPPLRYGDEVKVKNKDTRLSEMVGKIVGINSISASVKFEGSKKAQLIMLNALERV